MLKGKRDLGYGSGGAPEIEDDELAEVLSGLEAGDEVITGPFSSVRELDDGDSVKIEETKE